MKINYRQQILKITVNGNIIETPLNEPKFKHWIKSIILLCFKKINHKHINIKDDYGRLRIKKILDIRGIRTCSYETLDGQVILTTFMWKLGKYYI